MTRLPMNLTPTQLAYNAWIDQKLSTADPFIKCEEWTTEMQQAFPELEHVAGEVILSNGWARHHWWLKTPDGQIVDPTKSQFQQSYYGNARIVSYCEIPEDERPTGKCFNCGEYCYGGRTELCSPECELAYVAYVNSSSRWI